MEYVVDNETGGIRVDAFLARVLTGVSRARVQKLIGDGRVVVNGSVVLKKNVILENNDRVCIDECGSDDVLADPSTRIPKPQDIFLDVIYEDDFFAVINKPAGLVVHPGSGNHDGTVVNAILYRFGADVSSGADVYRPGIVHRLDKDTSGALMIAKTDVAHTALANLFSSRAIRKIYTGFCVGGHPQDHEIIDQPLSRSRRDPTKRVVDQHGDQAVTEYHLKKYHCGISLIEFVLHTGRTHQIRVHCGYRGFPIVQDWLYGGHQDKITTIPPMERPFAYGVFKCFGRHALHARALGFVHPFTNEDMEIIAPYPRDFCSALSYFG
jgi:23S rRNA pseudouridine1911/1915/1917 synthase